MNPNKWFKSLSIKAKLIIAFVSFTLLPLSIMGSYAIYMHIQDLEDIEIACLNQDVLNTSGKLQQFLLDSEDDIRLLSESFPVVELTEGLKHEDNSRRNELIKNVEYGFNNFAVHRNIYYQITFILLTGKDTSLIRYNRTTGKSFFEPNLDISQNTIFFDMIRDLDTSSVSFAPIEFEEEGKGIKTINYAIPFFNDKKKTIGVLATSIYADQFINLVNEYNSMGNAFLLNNNGRFIYNSNNIKKNANVSSLENFKIGTVKSLYDHYPTNIVDKIVSGQSGAIAKGTNEILSYAPIILNNKDNNYIFCRSVPKDTIFSSVLHYRNLFLGFILLSLSSAIIIGYVAARQFTKPIENLIRGSEIIAAGNYNYVIEVITNDELEILGQKFNIMASAIRERESELRDHRNHLEIMVQERTHQLSEEKTKLQAILDNVPSAFILLDDKLCIQSTSAAFYTMSGCNLIDVKGKYCHDCKWTENYCSDYCTSKEALVKRKIVTEITNVKTENGTAYIEHISIPIIKNNIVESVLEIVTDVTERKKLERQLIQSETLLTIGAFSAVVAHEIRNALASIKIILLLQDEAEKKNNSYSDLHNDEISMNAVIKSINRMELLVKDLLNFSKPSPLKFTAVTPKELIENSIQFASLQFAGKDIKLIKNIDDTLPTLMLDPNAITEVLTNLILNSYQSIQDNGVITVNAKRIKLNNLVEDYMYYDNFENMNADLSDMYKGIPKDKILFNEGTKVIELTIEDNGCGITKQNIPRIFEPFFTTKSRGTGLGLAIVKRTINEHGGIIKVESQENTGSIFTIYLPINNN